MLAGVCIASLTSVVGRYRDAQAAASYVAIDRDLFDALVTYRLERSDGASVLATAPDKAQALVASLAARRAKVDQAIKEATEGMAEADAPVMKELAARVRSTYQAIKSLRAETDAAVQLPMASRDPAFPPRAMVDGGKVLASIDEISQDVDRQIRLLDPTLLRFIAVRSMAAATRNATGNSAVMMSGVLRQARPFTAEEKITLLTEDAKGAFAWNAVREAVAPTDMPADLKAAFAKGQDSYFGGPFKTMRDSVVAALSSGATPTVSAEDWRAKVIPALDTVGDVAFSAMDALAITAAEAATTARNGVVFYSVLLGIAIVVAIISLSVVVRRVTNPISRLTGAMEGLAGGDLSVEVPGASRTDEIGSMAKAVLVFKEEMSRNAELEHAATEARLKADEERKRSIRELADNFEREVGGIIGSVSTSSEELHKTASRMAAAAERTSSQSTAVASAANEASTNVVMVASSAEELGSSVDEIARQVERSAQMSADAVTEATKTGEVIRELSVAAARIGDFVGLISNIASQTNLLALNATIEAARAGDSGKGFAVVASEVKELATQTAKATEEIEAQISSIQSTTEHAVRVIEGVSTLIRKMSDVATGISAAVEEQGIATREIVRNVDHAAQGTNSVTGNISDVARTADETGDAAGLVLVASSALTEQARRLNDQMLRFLGTVRAA
ncbi:methyl-accepting chemotaxis protein [Aquabacter sp. CN5-332]|uniref:methyl-accepting chemotaxis protein n=1 Tax=Aquabacter sp. CN5-332 TaxID=3156608 RepID=UPI0032B585AD